MFVNRLRWMLLGIAILLACILYNQYLLLSFLVFNRVIPIPQYYEATLPIGLIAVLIVLITCFLPAKKDAT